MNAQKNNMQDNIIVKKMEGFPEGVTFWEAFNKETGEIILAGYVSKYQIEKEALAIMRR